MAEKSHFDALLDQFGDAVWSLPLLEGEYGVETRLAMRSVRLLRLRRLNAPAEIIENERELIRKSVSEFPPPTDCTSKGKR